MTVIWLGFLPPPKPPDNRPQPLGTSSAIQKSGGPCRGRSSDFAGPVRRCVENGGSNLLVCADPHCNFLASWATIWQRWGMNLNDWDDSSHQAPGVRKGSKRSDSFLLRDRRRRRRAVVCCAIMSLTACPCPFIHSYTLVLSGHDQRPVYPKQPTQQQQRKPNGSH